MTEENLLSRLARSPLPPADERFVEKVMADIRRKEGSFWGDFWKIPALGFGLAAVLFAAVTAVRWPIENALSPDGEEVLEFALEDL